MSHWTLNPEPVRPETTTPPVSSQPADPVFRVEGRLGGRRHVPLRGAKQQFEPWAEIVVAGSLVQRSGATGRFAVDVAGAHVSAWPD